MAIMQMWVYFLHNMCTSAYTIGITLCLCNKTIKNSRILKVWIAELFLQNEVKVKFNSLYIKRHYHVQESKYLTQC